MIIITLKIPFIRGGILNDEYNPINRRESRYGAWLAVAEKIGQVAEAESREADKNGHFSSKGSGSDC